MATSVCVEPSLWSFAANRGHDIHEQCRGLSPMSALGFHHSSSRFSLSQLRPTISTLTCRCALQVPLSSKQASTGAPWSARLRLRQRERGSALISVSRVDRLGLDSLVDRKASERDASVTTSAEESGIANGDGALELVDTEGINFEEGDDGNDGINGMLRQPRNYVDEDDDVDNWQIFAAEEGARPSDDDETESEMEDGPSENLVKRRKADEVLPFPDSAAMNWSAADKEKVQALHAFEHRHESERGQFVVQAMRPKHMTDTEELLVDSFAELMGGLLTYRPLLAFTVKQYVRERYATLPHSVTLVGLYAPVEGIILPDTDESSDDTQQRESLVAGTVELSFSVAGHPEVSTPAPPPNSPYICNMAIKQEYRRRGLGRQMLKAAEDLALSMGCEDMYLHVRIMDTAPLTMYKEAGYQVVSTDSLLSVLTFQRRRHLMRKRLCQAKLVPE